MSEKHRKILIDFLVEITDFGGSKEIRNFLLHKYSKVIKLNKDGSLVCERKLVTEQEFFLISIAIQTMEYYFNSSSKMDFYLFYAAFVDNVTDALNKFIPNDFIETIKRLSYEKYEKKIVNSIVIANVLKPIDCVIHIDKNHQYSFNVKNLHGIRKLCEMIGKDQCLIVETMQDNKSYVKGIAEIKNIQKCIRFELKSIGEWSIFLPNSNNLNGSELLKYKHEDIFFGGMINFKELLKFVKIGKDCKKKGFG